MKKTLLLAGVACLFAANANAEFKLNPYVGADYNYDFWRMDRDARDALKDHSNGGTVVAGVKLNKWLGAEAFYQLSVPETKNVADEKYHSRLQAYGVDVLGYLPLGCDNKFELLAGLGIGEYEVKYRVTNPDFQASDKEEGIGYRLTAGAQYNLDANWSIRGTYRHVYVNKMFLNDLNELSLGVRYNF